MKMNLLIIALCGVSVTLGITIPATFYSYQNIQYSMFYVGDFGGVLPSKVGIITNFPQLNPNALIEENLQKVLAKMEKEADNDIEYYVRPNSQWEYNTAKVIMDASSQILVDYWKKYVQLNCTNDDGGVINQIRQNGALFPGRASILDRVEYDYQQTEVVLHMCNFVAVNTTHVQDIEEVEQRVPFSVFGSKTFNDYDITLLKSGLVGLSNSNEWNIQTASPPSVAYLLQKQAVKTSDFVPGDGIPLEFSQFSTAEGEKDWVFNAVDVGAIGMLDRNVYDTYHDICQSSHNYDGHYEAPYERSDWDNLMLNNTAGLNKLCESVHHSSNIGFNITDGAVLLAGDQQSAFICYHGAILERKAPWSVNSTYREILGGGVETTHVMCLNFDASMGIMKEDLTTAYCNRLQGRDVIERCLQRVLRNAEQGTEYAQAIADGDNSLALLEAIMVALRMMDDTISPAAGQASLIATLYSYILNA